MKKYEFTKSKNLKTKKLEKQKFEKLKIRKIYKYKLFSISLTSLVTRGGAENFFGSLGGNWFVGGGGAESSQAILANFQI